MTIAAIVVAGPLAPAIAAAHEYNAGPIEIVHPAIMAPVARAGCTCAHVKIVNHGNQTEYFLGARVVVAGRTELMQFAEFGREASLPTRVPIPPGATFDLHRHSWCLFMSGLKSSFEADMGAYSGLLLFERAGELEIELMVDDATHAHQHGEGHQVPTQSRNDP